MPCIGFLEEEAKKQSNIEEITRKAITLLSGESEPQNIENDWITNFFDKSRIVSDSDMQQLWAKVLASEANSSGSFSRKTVNLMSDLEKRDAELFTSLCGFGWMIGNVVPLVFEAQDTIYNQMGINFNTLSHLENLGLIQFENIGGFNRLNLPKTYSVFFYGTPVDLSFPNESGNQLNLGHVLLSTAGQELAPICGSKPTEGFLDFVVACWEQQSLSPSVNKNPTTQTET